VPAVLARIAAADGWLARAAGSQQMVKDDVRAIRDHCVKVGRDPDSLRYGHLNFAHLVDTSDRDEALRLQRPVFERVMGTHRTFENLQQSYFLGTTSEIVARVRDLEAAGIQDMVLATCDYDLEQLERFATDIVARFARAR
jgi:alkanesulfonate monooxygenase SsuD/methylene tetrahydromethanopterin reductase-like flavin-dependent oxidoreductase (luciferase family)